MNPHGDPPRDPSSDLELATLFLMDIATPEQRREVETRLALDPGFRREFEGARLVWERSSAALTPGNDPAATDRRWDRLQAAVRAEEASRGEPPRPTASQRAGGARRRAWAARAVAASAVLAVGVTTWTHQRPNTHAGAADRADRHVVARPGQRITVRLADGSRVLLAPGSQLRVPRRFDEGAREVTLAGRAFFSVTHDATRPFRVHAGKTLTRVLGTEFEVRAYPEESDVEVVVRSGSVTVRAERAAGGRVLRRGDHASVSAQGPVRVASVAEPDSVFGWTSGRLSFRRVPFRDVVRDLERWFDLEIVLTDAAVAARRVTAEFRDDESDDVVLRTLSDLLDLDLRRDGRRVTFAGKSTAPALH